MHTTHWGTDDPSAPRALLVHGLTSSGPTWWQIAEGLAAAGYSVLAPDLPGHGESAPVTSYRHADLAAEIAALGTGFDLYVGHSLGGTVAVPLLVAHPGFARRTVLLDPVIALSDADADATREDSLAFAAAPNSGAIAAQNPRWARRTVAARVTSLQQVDPAAVTAIIGDNRPWDVFDLAGVLADPVHVLAASDDAAFSAADGQRLAAQNPLWTWEIVPDTGHSVHRDRPEFVLGRLLAVR